MEFQEERPSQGTTGIIINSYHLTNISSFTFLTSWTRQALRRKDVTHSCPFLITNAKCSLLICLVSTHLQPNWTRRSRESSGTFISFLAEQTLLASGTGLTICTLKRSPSTDTEVETQSPDSRMKSMLKTYSWTGCSDRSLRASRTRWTLRKKPKQIFTLLIFKLLHKIRMR